CFSSNGAQRVTIHSRDHSYHMRAVSRGDRLGTVCAAVVRDDHLTPDVMGVKKIECLFNACAHVRASLRHGMTIDNSIGNSSVIFVSGSAIHILTTSQQEANHALCI